MSDKPRQDDKASRLSAALRANLRRRKEQVRGQNAPRSGGGSAGKAENTPPAGPDVDGTDA